MISSARLVKIKRIEGRKTVNLSWSLHRVQLDFPSSTLRRRHILYDLFPNNCSNNSAINTISIPPFPFQESLNKFEERLGYFSEETSVLEWIVDKEGQLATFSEEGGVAKTGEEEERIIAALETLRIEIFEFKTRMIDFEIRHTENVMGEFFRQRKENEHECGCSEFIHSLPVRNSFIRSLTV